jgi:hypothetical protein
MQCQNLACCRSSVLSNWKALHPLQLVIVQPLCSMFSGSFYSMQMFFIPGRRSIGQPSNGLSVLVFQFPLQMYGSYVPQPLEFTSTSYLVACLRRCNFSYSFVSRIRKEIALPFNWSPRRWWRGPTERMLAKQFPSKSVTCMGSSHTEIKPTQFQGGRRREIIRFLVLEGPEIKVVLHELQVFRPS